MSWQIGDYLTHRFNPQLGVGRVVAVEGRAVVVAFDRSKAKLRFAINSDALVAQESAARPVDRPLLDRLASGDVDPLEDFRIRLDVLHLLALREAGGLGSFLGGRVLLFPHQLYVAERASGSIPVRWLLADEVGLGKTIEAALILNRLLHTGRVQRCLIVAPETLTIQWLGELWRKYHHVFTLLDEARLADVERDFGHGFNPFDVHRRAIVSLELLTARPQLTDQAVAAGIDLLIVDEAQRMRRAPRHPGEPAWRAIAPIASLGRHVLLLTATPLEDDAHGFFRLLQLLRPEEFPEDASFENRLTSGVPLPPCTSATRRVEIGGLPPRVGVPVALENGWQPRLDLIDALRRSEATNAVARRRKIERIRRALASGAAFIAVLGADERELRRRALGIDEGDPRLLWLLAHAPRWRDAGDKTLVFVAHRETLEMLRQALKDRAQVASGMFHEQLSAGRRDIEVARFRQPDGPSILVSTECGGEGRNFEFCRRLVVFDLPWAPSVVEQRIGRLDRIGRRIPVEIVYFRPPRGIGADVVRLFEALGLFREPLAGVEPQLAPIEGALEEIAADANGSLSPQRIDALVWETRAARTRIREAAYQQLHRDPYRPEMAAEIMARIPPELDTLTEEIVLAACARFGFAIEQPRGRHVFAIELGHEAMVESLPGVPAGASFVGTFNRDKAVEDETLDFFASGHPLVEGLFSYVEDSAIGRVAQLEIAIGDERGEGIVVIYRDGSTVDVVALDSSGRRRPEWAAAFLEHPLPARRIDRDVAAARAWRATIRRVGARLDPSRSLYALAAIVVNPAAGTPAQRPPPARPDSSGRRVARR